MISSNWWSRATKLAADNSPTILTAIGVTGTIATAVLSGRASFKAAEILERDRQTATLEYEQSFRRCVELTWFLYIPAVGTGFMTVAAIIMANRIGMRRAAAIAAAYSLSERAFSEYRTKVIDKVGEKAEQRIRDDVAQDSVDRNPVVSKEVIITDGGEVLCHDSITGRYFNSSIEALRKAQNDINAQIFQAMYASLADFYDLVGLPTTDYAYEVGWNTDNMLELEFSTVLSKDSRPCVSVAYGVYPIRGHSYLQ
jgi:hypothetical protein